jgi:outer membrane murein-binding lipoprotein Lpp
MLVMDRVQACCTKLASIKQLAKDVKQLESNVAMLHKRVLLRLEQTSASKEV